MLKPFMATMLTNFGKEGEMSGYFSIWEKGSGNFVAEYDDGPSALELIAGLIGANGSWYADQLDLAWISADDQAQHIATGAALIALTHGLKPHRPRPRRVATVYRRRHIIRDAHREPVASS